MVAAIARNDILTRSPEGTSGERAAARRRRTPGHEADFFVRSVASALSACRDAVNKAGRQQEARDVTIFGLTSELSVEGIEAQGASQMS